MAAILRLRSASSATSGSSPRDPHIGIAAKLNIGAAASHIGGDRHSAGNAGLGDDLRLLLVISGIEDAVGNIQRFQLGGEPFRFLDRGGADEDRLVALRHSSMSATMDLVFSL